jgi:hypothetical protein
MGLSDGAACHGRRYLRFALVNRDLANMVDAAQPKSGKRGPYRTKPGYING